MMSRWISLVPPPNVRMSARPVHPLDPPAQHRARRPVADDARGPEHLHQQPVGGRRSSVPNTFVADASAGWSGSPSSASQAMRRFISRSTST